MPDFPVQFFFHFGRARLAAQPSLYTVHPLPGLLGFLLSVLQLGHHAPHVSGGLVLQVDLLVLRLGMAAASSLGARDLVKSAAKVVVVVLVNEVGVVHGAL